MQALWQARYAVRPVLHLRGLSTEGQKTIKGINVLKGGQDPTEGPMEQYPDWLYQQMQRGKTLGQLERQAEADGSNMSFMEVRRMLKLQNRAKISEKNTIKALGMAR